MGNCVSIDLSSLCICCYDRTAAEVMYIWEFKDNLEALKSSKKGLWACRADLMTKLQAQEGPQMKPLQTVQLWLDSVDTKLNEVKSLIARGDNEIDENMCLGGCCYKNSISTYALGRSFVDTKLQLDDLINQREQFRESLVARVPDQPDHIRDLRRDAKDLKVARNKLKATSADLELTVASQEGGPNKRLEAVREWFKRVDSMITEVDKVIDDAPREVEKWSVKDYSNGGFGELVARKLKDVNSLIAEGVFSRVVEKVTAEPEYISRVKDELEDLKRARDELLGLHADVKRKVKIEEAKQKQPWKQVELWLRNAEDTIAEVGILLTEAPQEVNKLHQLDSCSNFGEKVEKRLKDVDELIKKGRQFQEVAYTALPEKVVEQDCEQTPVGLQEKIDDVWSLLMKEDVGIVGLYGMGGVGKTTLLKHVNNKFLDKPMDFDYVIWVTVSHDFTLSKVQEEIGERIGISDSDWKKNNNKEKAKDIRNILRKKKFVLLLDDVWEKLHLETAGVPEPNKNNGSKIVLSTRDEMVCSLMGTKKNRFKVETLATGQAWQLFKDYVGVLDPAIEPVAKQVAEECDGLPLALIVVARAVACCKTREEWTFALNDLRQSVSDLQGIKEVFARLKISYDKLPDNKCRSCFVYCALFPEDFKIYKDDLVDYWISEKFEDDEDNKSITRSMAHKIISHLVHACLLEEEGKYVKMHDMIRDMALWISCEVEKPKYNFLAQAGKQLNKAPEVEKWEGVKRASLMKNSLRNLPEVSVCPDLRTLLLCRNPHLNEISASIIHFWRALTVLDLSNTRVQELPSGISEANSLQHLNLSRTWIEKLPPQLKRLSKLKYLNLEHNDFLGMIPKEIISSFPSLQVLRMFRCGFFYGGAEDNVLSDSNVHIGEMQHLEHLNVVSITIRSADALQLYFRDMQDVQSCTQALSLECISGSNSLEFSPTEAMEKLETLQISASEDLEQIKFKYTLREKLSFSSLREVCVEYCSKLSNLGWLILAPNLEVLKVAVCGNMEEIINDGKCGDISNVEPFSKLEVVTLEDLPQLKSIHWNSSLFPALKRMRVIDCPMLKKLPLKSDSGSGIKGRKTVIEAEEEWWKILEWENPDTEAAFQSSFKSCPPRTRICRAAHHFFDLWKRH